MIFEPCTIYKQPDDWYPVMTTLLKNNNGLVFIFNSLSTAEFFHLKEKKWYSDNQSHLITVNKLLPEVKCDTVFYVDIKTWLLHELLMIGGISTEIKDSNKMSVVVRDISSFAENATQTVSIPLSVQNDVDPSKNTLTSNLIMSALSCVRDNNELFVNNIDTAISMKNKSIILNDELLKCINKYIDNKVDINNKNVFFDIKTYFIKLLVCLLKIRFCYQVGVDYSFTKNDRIIWLGIESKKHKDATLNMVANYIKSKEIIRENIVIHHSLMFASYLNYNEKWIGFYSYLDNEMSKSLLKNIEKVKIKQSNKKPISMIDIWRGALTYTTSTRIHNNYLNDLMSKNKKINLIVNVIDERYKQLPNEVCVVTYEQWIREVQLVPTLLFEYPNSKTLLHKINLKLKERGDVFVCFCIVDGRLNDMEQMKLTSHCLKMNLASSHKSKYKAENKVNAFWLDFMSKNEFKKMSNAATLFQTNKKEYVVKKQFSILIKHLSFSDKEKLIDFIIGKNNINKKQYNKKTLTQFLTLLWVDWWKSQLILGAKKYVFNGVTQLLSQDLKQDDLYLKKLSDTQKYFETLQNKLVTHKI